MMKLTIEEKAKAYDDALERAEKALEVFGTDKCEGARQIFSLFPELKESEDDRIRKELIKHLKEGAEGYEPAGNTEDYTRWLSWLEKQGYTKKDVDDAYLKGICNTKHELEKQGEHPRYSIGDVLCDKSCTTLNKDTQPNFEIVDIKNGMYICDKGSFPISQQDEYELVAKKIDQTSQRMVSAEAKEALYDKPTDKEMKELLRTEYEKGRADTIAEIKKVWGEEDEVRLQACIDCLQAKSLMGKVDTVMTNWLKSLKDRYTWKPRKELIEALEDDSQCGVPCRRRD